MNQMALHLDKSKFIIPTRQKRLEVITDNDLASAPHVNTLCKKISAKVFQLSKIKYAVNIQSVIECGSTLSDSASKNSFKPLHSLFTRVLKLILLKHSSLEQDHFNLLNTLPLHSRLKFNK